MIQLNCPVCWRVVGASDGIVKAHVDTAFMPCPMSRRPVPPSSLRQAELEESAAHVMRLAAELRDDLDAFHNALADATNAQLREWLVIALAAVDVDRPMSELLAWVEGLRGDVEAVA
ncbi:DUF7368 family protein [Mycobacterium celatum]